MSKAIRLTEDQYRQAQQRLNRFGEAVQPPGRPKGAKAHKINAGKANAAPRLDTPHRSGPETSPQPERVPAPNKYRNVPTDGKDSKREAKRASELRALAAAGAITDLREQVRYELIPRQNDANGRCLFRAVTYTLDFQYRQQGVMHYEDSKGYPNDRWPMKKALMYWRHGILVEEV